MACSSVNRTDPVKKMEKALMMKKQLQSMSNYTFIVVSSRAPVSLCSERLQNDRHLCKSMLSLRS